MLGENWFEPSDPKTSDSQATKGSEDSVTRDSQEQTDVVIEMSIQSFDRQYYADSLHNGSETFLEPSGDSFDSSEIVDKFVKCSNVENERMGIEKLNRGSKSGYDTWFSLRRASIRNERKKTTGMHLRKQIGKLRRNDENLVSDLFDSEFIPSLLDYLSNPNLVRLCNMIIHLTFTNHCKFLNEVFFFFSKNHWKMNVTPKQMISILNLELEKALRVVEFALVDQLPDTELLVRSFFDRLSHSVIDSRLVQKLACVLEDTNGFFLHEMNQEIGDYLPFKNGIMCLNTGDLKPYNPRFFNRNVIPYSFQLFANEELVMNFLNDLFIDENEREYALYVLSTFITERVPNDKITFFIGEGANGKSVLITLMQMALGKYACSTNSSVFTKICTNDEAAVPMMLSYQFVRVAFVVEPEQKVFKAEVVKKLCGGGDVIRGRNLYSPDIVSFEMRTKFVVCCNELPTFSIPITEPALKRRLQIIHFKTSFVDDCTLSHHRPIKDIREQIQRRSPAWESGLIKILVKYHEKYRDNPPPGIDLDTFIMPRINDYPTLEDAVVNFCETRLDIADLKVKTCVATTRDLYNYFTAYLSEKHGSGILKSKNYNSTAFSAKLSVIMQFKYNRRSGTHRLKAPADFENDKEIFGRGYPNVRIRK